MVPCECQLTGHFVISIICSAWLEVLPICIRFCFIIYDIRYRKLSWRPISICNAISEHKSTRDHKRCDLLHFQVNQVDLVLIFSIKKNRAHRVYNNWNQARFWCFFLRKIIEKKNACFEWQLKMMMVFYVSVCFNWPFKSTELSARNPNQNNIWRFILGGKNDSFRAKSYPNEEKNKLGQWQTIPGNFN